MGESYKEMGHLSQRQQVERRKLTDQRNSSSRECWQDAACDFTTYITHNNNVNYNSHKRILGAPALSDWYLGSYCMVLYIYSTVCTTA